MGDAEKGQGGDGSETPPPDPKVMQQQAAGKRLQQQQAQVDEVVGLMKDNVDRVLERDTKLASLDERADHLQAGASQFEATSGKLKNKYFWKNMKMMIILGVVIVLVLAIGGVYIAQNIGGGGDAAGTPPTPINQPYPNGGYYNVPPPQQPGVVPDGGAAPVAPPADGGAAPVAPPADGAPAAPA